MEVDTPNGRFMVDMDDVYIRNHMATHRVYESHIINGFIRPYIKKSQIIVDVGANIGCHAVSYAGFNPQCKIWAFEPQKKLHDILIHNVNMNNYSERIEVFNCGLGHENQKTSLGRLETVWCPTNSGHNKGGLGIGEGGETMEMITLDSLNLPGLDFMKIDVEGAEGLVIQGAAETIKKYKPIIFFEHNKQAIDPKVLGLDHVPSPFMALTALGYKTFEYVDWDNYITEG
jgi:hypothetical protein